MKSISFTFLFLLSIFIHAQNSSDADSLFSKSENLLYQKPSESAKIAQFLFENSTQENDKIKSLLILIESNLIRGDYSTAIEKLFQTWELSSHSKNLKNKTKINSLINRICSKLGIDQRKLYLISDNLGKNDSAESYTQKVKDIEPYSSFLKSKNLFSEGNFNQSIEALDNLKPFNKIQDVQLREEIYILNARNYKEIKDWKQYQIHYNLQNALHDSVSILKENARILFITKINQKQDAILETKSENQTRIMYIVVGLIFIVFTIGYLWNRKLNFRKNNFEKIIKEKEEKIKLEAENKVQEGAGKIVIPDKTIHALLRKLEEFEQNEDYLDPSMSLNLLAENLESNTKYLSEIINTYKNKNFHSYINDLRVNYIIDKLQNNPVYLKYKVSHLAEEAGFSSHSLFSTVFKQVTGLSPAAYTKLITKEEPK